MKFGTNLCYQILEPNISVPCLIPLAILVKTINCSVARNMVKYNANKKHNPNESLGMPWKHIMAWIDIISWKGMTVKVASCYLKIYCSMTGANTYTFGTTSWETVYREEPFGWSTFRQMNKRQTFSPRHFANTFLWCSETSWGCYRIPSSLRGSVRKWQQGRSSRIECVLSC